MMMLMMKIMMKPMKMKMMIINDENSDDDNDYKNFGNNDHDNVNDINLIEKTNQFNPGVKHSTLPQGNQPIYIKLQQSERISVGVREGGSWIELHILSCTPESSKTNKWLNFEVRETRDTMHNSLPPSKKG